MKLRGVPLYSADVVVLGRNVADDTSPSLPCRGLTWLYEGMVRWLVGGWKIRLGVCERGDAGARGGSGTEPRLVIDCFSSFAGDILPGFSSYGPNVEGMGQRRPGSRRYSEL